MSDLSAKELVLLSKLNDLTKATSLYNNSKYSLMYLIDFITYHLVPSAMMLVIVWLSRHFMPSDTLHMLELFAVFAPVAGFSMHRISSMKEQGFSSTLCLPFLLGFLVDARARKHVRHYTLILKEQCLQEVMVVVSIKELLPNISDDLLDNLINEVNLGLVDNEELYRSAKKHLA